MKYQRALVPVVLLLLISAVNANVWTVDCGVLTTQRMDPIVFPFQSPAGHVHSIAGGSRFSESVSYDELVLSGCTSCNVKDDLSNYWVPQLYVKKGNSGKYHYVDMEFHAYYKLITDRGQSDRGTFNPLLSGHILPFPTEFRMLAGSPHETGPLHYITHQCYGPYTTTHEFPPHPEECTGGVRSEVTFPSCWDGINDGSDGDHKSHMAYPGPDGFWEAGACPPSHPKRLPTLFFEAIFKTYDVPLEVGDSLVYSFGDTTGYGFHGDFLNGWKKGVMQSLLDYCVNNDDGRATMCGIDKGTWEWDQCTWEGPYGQDDQYKGILDEIPYGTTSADDCFDHGLDYYGGDLNPGQYVSTESAQACQDNCQQTSGCEFWTWSPNYYNACWRKSTQGEVQVNSAVISGPAYC